MGWVGCPWNHRQALKASSKPWPLASLAVSSQGQGCLYFRGSGGWLAGQELGTQQGGAEQGPQPGRLGLNPALPLPSSVMLGMCIRCSEPHCPHS